MPDLPEKKELFHNFILALATGVVYYFSVMTYGTGITDDSVNYLSAAASFPDLTKIDGAAFTEWPPLYPFLLSLYKITWMKIPDFAAALNGLSFCLSILLMHSMTKDFFRNRYIYLMYVICLLFSLPLLQSFVFIWSEGIFILLILIAVRSLDIYIKKPTTAKFILLILISMLMCLQRKSGIIFTGAFTLIILMFKGGSRKALLAEALGYLSLSATPFILWTYRRYLISGSATGGAAWEPSRIWENIQQSADILSSWLMPDEIPLLLRSCVLITAIIASIMAYKRSGQNPPADSNNIVYFSFTILITYVIILCLIFLYLKADEPIDDRLLSPVYMFFIFLVFTGIDKLLSLVRDYNIVRNLLIMAMILLPAYFIIRTAYHIKRWNQDGTGGYNTRIWNESSLVKYLRDEKPPQIFSNNIYALSYQLNFKSSFNITIRDLEEKTTRQAKAMIVYFSAPYSHPSVKNGNFAIDTSSGKILLKTGEGIIIQE